MQHATFLIVGGVSLTLAAAGILTYDLARELQHRRALASRGILPAAIVLPIRLRTTVAFVLLAWAPLLLAMGLLFRACIALGASGG